MRVLLIDCDAVGLAFAWRCSRAGHTVRWFIRDNPTTNNAEIGEGFPSILRIDNWVASIDWADLIWVSTNTYYMQRLEQFRKRGSPYFGPSVGSTELEIKRSEGMSFLERNGIDVPPYKTFRDLKEAEAYVRRHDKRWVFKTLGDNEDKSLSYCSKSPADMVARLQLWQERGIKPKGDVMLQEFIDGIEVGVSRWLGTKGWVSPPNINFEHKKLMPSNYGPNTGEMGTVMCYVKDDKLDKDVIQPLERGLMAMGHTGDMDVNTIVDNKGKAWPLEFTNRPGWPAFNIMLAQHKGDPVQWMKDALEGKATLDVSYDVAVGVVLACGDFPAKSKDPEKTNSLPIYGLHNGNKKHFAPQSVKIRAMPDVQDGEVVDRSMWVTADDYVGVVTGLGTTVSVAAKRAYSTVKELHIPDMIVRDDIGECLEAQLPKLHKLGYALGIKY